MMTEPTKQSKAQLPDNERSNLLVKKYLQLGHSGFILWFRSIHSGEDPEPELLAWLADRYEQEKSSKPARMFRAVVDALS